MYAYSMTNFEAGHGLIYLGMVASRDGHIIIY